MSRGRGAGDGSKSEGRGVGTFYRSKFESFDFIWQFIDFNVIFLCKCSFVNVPF